MHLTPMSASTPLAYRIVRWVLRAAVGVYFTRIVQFHRERAPRTGPALFTSNHPNSMTDAFVIGLSVPRKVNFVATVQMFRLAPLRWLLVRCGVIPINRLKDDPRAMRTVLNTFEICFGVLERGEAIGIFPEGVTHDDPQLKNVKTGAARMALELEHRHGGKLGVRIVPVGLTFSAKETYRSDVLVNFGEPIRVADYLAGYPERKRECIHALTSEIERSIEDLILHLPRLERSRIVAAVKRLYLERLRLGSRVIHEPVPPQVGELILTQAISDAVDFICDHHPERAAVFARNLDRYERWLNRLRLPDEAVAHLPDGRRLGWRSLAWTLLGVVLAPVAVYGWLHRWPPILVVNWARRKFARAPADKTHFSTASILAGVVSFSAFFGVYIAAFYACFGWPAALWYALSLPFASLTAHYYLRALLRIAVSMRSLSVLVRAPAAARRLLALRNELIAEIDAARRQVPAEALAHERRRRP